MSEESQSERDAFQELLDSLDPSTRTLIAEVDLGRQVPDFLRSDIGRYLVGCAQYEYAEAMEGLERTSPWRRRRIRDLQNQAWRARSFMEWLRGLVIAGKSAENALVEREE